MQYRLQALMIAIAFFGAMCAFPSLSVYLLVLAAALGLQAFGWVSVSEGIRSREKRTLILIGAPFLIVGVVVMGFALAVWSTL